MDVFAEDKMSKLSDGELASLISLWQNERCLWNSSCEEYSNADQKKAVVCRIAEELSLSEG